MDFYEDAAKSHGVTCSLTRMHDGQGRPGATVCGTTGHFGPHTVLRVVEAKEELEIKSDHALQWLDETMISWGLRGEGL